MQVSQGRGLRTRTVNAAKNTVNEGPNVHRVSDELQFDCILGCSRLCSRICCKLSKLVVMLCVGW